MPVVAGVDESPTAEVVVSRAIAEADWRGLPLHLVHVCRTPVAYADVPVDWATIHEAEREAIWGRLAETIDDAPVQIKKVDLDGYPPDMLAAYAKSQRAELLVVGTRGRGDLASLIMGSTSHRALHLSGCDVLVVREGNSD